MTTDKAADPNGLRACPYLVLADDPTLVLSEASPQHVCRAQRRAFSPELEFQQEVCLRAAHIHCQRYEQARADNVTPPAAAASAGSGRNGRRSYVAVGTVMALIVGAVLLVTAALNLTPRLPAPVPTQEVALDLETAQPTDTPTDTPRPTSTPTVPAASSPAPPSATPQGPPPTATRPGLSGIATRSAELESAIATEQAADGVLVALLPTATPLQGQDNPPEEAIELRLTPAGASSVGWWSTTDTGNGSIGDSFLYAGATSDAALISAARFDLSRIERGAPIYEARLELTGLVDERLDRDADIIWLAQLISEQELGQLVGASYMMIYSAPAAITLLPELRTADLGQDVVNEWVLDPASRAWLEQRLLEGERSITVRIVASSSGGDESLFAWDSGFGAKTSERPPALVLSVGPPPPTPPPLPTREYVVATFTPVPENVMTVVAQQATATAIALEVGTPTPLPPFVTPTSLPENLPTAQAAALSANLPAVVAHTPTPANDATATSDAVYATAVAVTTGTFTPVPTGYVTPYIILPSPPAENVATEVARVALSTLEAASITDLPTRPHNAIVGVYVIATPTPADIATAAAAAMQATLNAQSYGTPTATPWHWILITPTPLPVPTPIPTLPALVLSDAFTPTPVPTPTEVVPDSLPDEFRNLVFFQTLRGPQAEIYAYNPATSQVGTITRPWIYPLARKQLTLSPDGKQEVFVQRDANGLAQLHIRSLEYGTTRRLTSFNANSYDPTWSPRGDWIAFVTTNTGNDEIFLISPDGSINQQLTQNTWEWDKHPTWSPDGSQIVWFSNRDTGRRRLWIMDADGGNQRPLLDDEFESWDPVWTR